jgi:hypothetical protein
LLSTSLRMKKRRLYISEVLLIEIGSELSSGNFLKA